MMRKKAPMHALADACLMRTLHHASRKRNASGCPMQWGSASASEAHLGRAFLNTEPLPSWISWSWYLYRASLYCSTTIGVVLSLAVTNDWPLRQLDIQNAFLHGNRKE
nr:Gag/Pol polyprotein [Tanacetum cinerariifolium]